jgi:fused signal recognition particle receptor
VHSGPYTLHPPPHTFLIMGLFDKLFGKKEKETLDQGLQKTKEGFLSKITKAIAGKSTVDEEVLDNLEDALVSADVGIDTTVQIINRIEKRVAADKYLNTGELNRILQQEIEALLVDAPEGRQYTFDSPMPATPYVILVVGVNGVGKTTTIGKLANNFKKAGKNVLLGAADTFRAAAVDQLTIWSERAGVPIVKQDMGSDPAAVAFDTVQSGVSRGSDVIIIDTAGRLHNKAHLMDELGKIKRVIQKVIPEAPHEVMLVLDGSTGQNALEQARHFTAATNVTALAITKLDGTAKGGVVLAIANQFKIPVKFIGVGEKMEDLLVFDKHEFVDSLFNLERKI